MPPSKTLADLSEIIVAKVLTVLGDDPVSRRLREMGFTPGTAVYFERQAPFGGPMIVSLRNYQLTLRPAEARRILIEGLSES
ncbi:MAG: FeoA family protein [Planctomycetota bacterium]|jgi:Fe2+ transport system protein FeoA|nr:FeoA family protein [Planctomycetota bacterium]